MKSVVASMTAARANDSFLLRMQTFFTWCRPSPSRSHQLTASVARGFPLSDQANLTKRQIENPSIDVHQWHLHLIINEAKGSRFSWLCVRLLEYQAASVRNKGKGSWTVVCIRYLTERWGRHLRNYSMTVLPRLYSYYSFDGGIN